MLVLRVTGLLVVVTMGAGCIAGVLPPTRTELGSTVVSDRGAPRTGLRVASGVHLASGTRDADQDTDLGVGYVFERQSAAPQLDTVAVTSMPYDRSATTRDAHGLYLEYAHAIERTRTRRGWLGARAELLRQDTGDGAREVYGVYGRAAWELFAAGETSGSSSDACAIGAGFARGTFALGVYVESGARVVEDRGTAFVATGGLSLRLPILGGFAVNLCPHC